MNHETQFITETEGLGEKLHNGAVIVAQSNNIVLAIWHGGEYVTWEVNEVGDAFWGHYHLNNLEAALSDYNERVERKKGGGNKADNRELEILDIFQDAIDWDSTGVLADAIKETIEEFLEYTDELSDKEKRWAYDHLNIKMTADLA